jgi:hypothetical protein
VTLDGGKRKDLSARPDTFAADIRFQEMTLDLL